jgi:hypothetical protein
MLEAGGFGSSGVTAWLGEMDAAFVWGYQVVVAAVVLNHQPGWLTPG